MIVNGEDLPNLLNDAANSLRKARIERKPDLTIELRINFIRIKQFIELMGQESTEVTSSGNTAAKFSFIISNIHRNLKFIPGDYKKKVEDHNVCSIFYDLENLYEFNKNKPFPKELDSDLSREVVSLLDNLVRLYTAPKNRSLDLKPLNEIQKRVIKFDRDSNHFQYFSYYKDQEHLNRAIELIEFTHQLDITNISGRYQFISAITQIIEHISKRMLSPRMTNYLSSDINADDLSSIRNFIIHREQDKSNKFEEIISLQDDRLLAMKQELGDIGLSLIEALEHLRLAVKPRVMVGDVFQRVNVFITNAEDETIDSISKFYEKTDSSYKYTKIPHKILMNCKSIVDFEAAYPRLSSKITLNNKEVIINTALLGNRKLFIKVVNQIVEGLIRHRLYGDEDIKAEVTLLKKGNRVEITTLRQLEFSEIQPNLSEFEELIFVTKKIQTYKNKLKDVIQKFKSATANIEGNILYSIGIDFDAYRVMDIPLYSVSSFVRDSYAEVSIRARSIAPQRYFKVKDFYKIKFLYNEYELRTLNPEELGLGINPEGRIFYKTWRGGSYPSESDIGFDLYRKLVNMRMPNGSGITLTSEEEKKLINFIIAKEKLQFILIPLTHEEHAIIYRESLQPHEVSFRRDRILDQDKIQRLGAVFAQADMLERIKNYVAFLEMSEEFLIKRDLLLEAELYLIFIDHYNRLIDESHLLLPEEVTKLRDFRNYLAHDRELGETAISHSHEQITLRFVLEFTRKVECSVIPALRHMITDGRIIESQKNDVIVLNLHNIEYKKLFSYDEEDQNMLLVNLLQDPGISDQIVEFIHNQGLEKVKEFFFDKKNKNDVNFPSQDQKMLDNIENIKALIGEGKLSQMQYFYHFVSNALDTHSSNNIYYKIINFTGSLAKNIQQFLDLSIIYESLDISDQVLSMVEQLEYLAIFMGDASMVITYFRPKHFPDDDFYGFPGGGNGDELTMSNEDDQDIDKVLKIFLDYNISNYTMWIGDHL